MQRFSYRESVLLGYSPPKALMESSYSPKAPDIDFNDVFGGPPRRSSIQETRYSFGDNSDSSSSSSSFRTSDETSRRLSGLSEKPVFGEEGMNRRRYSKTDFFDDIFRGNDQSSSPRKYDMKDPFAPSSARLPSMAEPFATSLPTRFSLLNKGMDLPTFSSPTRSTSRIKDDSSNGLSYYATKHDETETKGNSMEDSTTSGISKDGAQFHFSIYKWENKGVVPLDIRGKGELKEQDNLQRCSSAKGWIGGESKGMKPKAKLHDSFMSTDRMSSNAKSFRVEHDKNGDLSSRIDSRNEDGERVRTIQEENIPKSESEIQIGFCDKRGEEIIKHRSKTLKLLIRDEQDNEQGNDEMTVNNGTKDISKKSENKLYEIIDGDNAKNPDKMKKASSNNKDVSTTRTKGNYEITKNDETKYISEKSDKKSHEILDGETIKKPNTTKRSTSNNFETSTTRVKGSPRNSWENGKGRVRRNVKDFIKIFNQDASSKPTTDDICHDSYQPTMTVDTVHDSHSSRQSEQSTIKPENELNVTVTQRDEKIHMPNLQTKKSSLQVPVANHLSKGISAKSTNGSVTDPVSDGSKTIIEDPRDSFDVKFLIEDLTPEEKIFPELRTDPEEIKAIDAKIQQWSNGKEGNIRSMLSTLQYVLWADSGWKPVPLVDIIEGPAVKRSYQKALLCLHPDKLQQKGAASEQKYIAEKVYDVLHDAWTHFNSLGSV